MMTPQILMEDVFRHAEFLHERLPHSKLDIIDSGHFIWEDAADDYAELVLAWWGGGYATAR